MGSPGAYQLLMVCCIFLDAVQELVEDFLNTLKAQVSASKH